MNCRMNGLKCIEKVMKIRRQGTMCLLWGGATLYSILYGNLFHSIKLIYNDALH